MRIHRDRFRSPIELDETLARIKTGGASTPLSIAEAAALVAERTKGCREPRRTVRNRVRMQLCRVLAAGASMPEPPEDGTSLVAQRGGRIRVDELVRWAALKYGGDRFKGLPRKRRELSVELADGIAVGGAIEGVALPGAPGAKDLEIERLWAELRQERSRHAATVRELEACKAELTRRDQKVARLQRHR